MKLDVHVQLMALKGYKNFEQNRPLGDFTPLLSHGVSHNIHIIW